MTKTTVRKYVAWMIAATALLARSLPADEKEAAPPPQKNLERAARYLEDRGGHAMLVYHGDKVIFEKYFNDYDRKQPHRLASGTKSFSGMLAAVAADDGLLRFDEPVAKTITEWKDDPLKCEITIRQLLSLTSGLDPGRNGRIPTFADSIDTDAIWIPGGEFRYGPTPFQVFGELMRRKLADRKESPLDYLTRKVFKPIGLEAGFWRKDADGNPHMPSGAFLTAREWAKFGLLVRDKGLWQGKRIVSEKNLLSCFRGTKANPDYGTTFWLTRFENAPRDLVMAAGAGKQKLYIVPSRKLLIVQMAESSNYREGRFLGLVFGDTAPDDR